jgi:uncharacterized membrane protein YhhN
MNSLNRNTILYAGALVAASYLATLFIDTPVPVEATWKAAGILLFSAFAFSRGAKLAGLGLLFSAGGDAALALEPPQFIAGMAFFGIAHLFYLAAFVVLIRKDGIDKRGYGFAALIVVASVAMLAWFLPGMGDLTAPGLAYQAIITAMVAAALLSKAPLLARAGAVVFMISDAMIALGLYKNIDVLPGSIWALYAIAQFMIAAGLAALRALAVEKPQ